MHFAFPPRKTSQPPPYERTSRTSPRYVRQRWRLLGYAVCCLLAIYFLIHASPLSHQSVEEVSLHGPPVVIVTVFDEDQLSDQYIQKIKTNRQDYASRHGYENFFTSASKYAHLVQRAPSSWSMVPAVRHALSLYPRTLHFFSLSPHGIIMAPSLSLDQHILAPERLESLMLKDVPIVPPDSIIHTFSHLTEDAVDLVMTQDGESLSHGSFILRRGEWANFFLDTWFDPLFRKYNFRKAEGHALEHIVQWHPTILAKIALVPQRIMNSFNYNISLSDGESYEYPIDSMYRDEDFLVHFHACNTVTERDCEREMEPYYRAWQEEVKRLDGKPSAKTANLDILRDEGEEKS